MGRLILHSKCFKFPLENKENLSALNDFLKAGNHARSCGDTICSTSDLYMNKYDWGDFASDFAFSSWETLRQNEYFSWVPQTLHQSLNSFFFQNPSGKSDFSDLADFFSHDKSVNLGILGCFYEEKDWDLVFNIWSWHQWTIKYFCENPLQFKWTDQEDQFLANIHYSESILYRELVGHNKHKELHRYSHSVGLTFHEEVMRKKGGDLMAYTIDIGGKVAEANFFKYEAALSAEEERLVHSARRIYSFFNSLGERIFISLDLAHGMFEYHDKNGVHLGEYKFDGSFNSPAESSHNLRCDVKGF